MFKVRIETEEDIPAVYELNRQTFNQVKEAELVNALRKNCKDILSIVGTLDDRVVGHILFSPVVINKKKKKVAGMGLGPMAVMPDVQKQGIGTMLISAGIKILKEKKCPFIVVLGHPGYYPRFGFEKASKHNVKSQWDVTEEAFMVLVLDRSYNGNLSGTAEYRSEFNNAV